MQPLETTTGRRMRPSSISSQARAFMVMPFGTKQAPDGTEVDFDALYRELFAPAIADAGLLPHRADADRRGGSIHVDMFQDLLLAEFVVADLTLDNPNVWYELGVRQALRSGGVVLAYAMRDRLPFDIAGQRMHRYTLQAGKLALAGAEAQRKALTEAIVATLGAWRGRRASPVYQLLPSLREPDWKTLKVGPVNELWEALEDWRSRVEVARRKQRPGDILVLAEETPNSTLEFEAKRMAAQALLKLNHPRYALSVLESARKLDPDDLAARQLEAVALGRQERFAEAREGLRRLSDQHRDGETLGLLARTWKDEWIQVWMGHPLRQTDPLAAARETSSTLHSAAAAYESAFEAAPQDYYPGINALTLGRLWEHVTGRACKVPLDLIAGGVRWAVAAAIARSADYWSFVTRAELELVEGRSAAIDDYAEACALAVGNQDWFALSSSRRQLALLQALAFRPELTGECMKALERAEQQLSSLAGARRAPSRDPQHVVVFSGHMIDEPLERGEGKAKPARFPACKAAAADARIRAALDEIGAGAGDLGICGGACGGDLLFAQACLDRGMKLELRLARPEIEFLSESVTFADPDRRWMRSFVQAKAHPSTTLLVMPEELGPSPEGISIHDRCNRWILYNALSHGPHRMSFVTLWDGVPSDRIGGTAHMAKMVRTLTGQQPILIDPGTL